MFFLNSDQNEKEKSFFGHLLGYQSLLIILGCKPTAVEVLASDVVTTGVFVSFTSPIV